MINSYEFVVHFIVIDETTYTNFNIIISIWIKGRIFFGTRRPTNIKHRKKTTNNAQETQPEHCIYAANEQSGRMWSMIMMKMVKPLTIMTKHTNNDH